MGNSHTRGSEHRNAKQSAHSNREGQAYTSQFSLSHFAGNLSGRSFVSVTSNQSVYSSSRPWSRVSRRRWNDATLKNPLEASKTAWPVAHKESIFLPEFPITTDLLQKDFVILEKIAKGAFGEVCKVKKLSVGKEYALKVLNKSQIVSENAVRQVKEECHIQEVCGHHSFIVGAVSRWQTKKRLYIISEYIPGGELLALLDAYGKLPEELVKLFVAEIATAIDFLHNAGVIYRDLKPENILLDSECHIQLIDFGLSKWLSVGARTTTLCGTLKYMAPEVMSREPYGHAVDWWSLGVLTCRMLTDQYPTPAIGARATCGNDTDSTSPNEIINDAGANGSIAPNYDSYLHRAYSSNEKKNDRRQPKPQEPRPGTLPEDSTALSNAARGLLLRLLELNPQQRMRSLRQMQQSAFYMGFNFDHVRTKKIAPRSVLERYFPAGDPDLKKHDPRETSQRIFESFDKLSVI